MKPAILLLLGCAGLPAQTMDGTVYDALTGAPVAGALVKISASMNDPAARTDTAGHFHLAAPTYPRYSVQASRAGYVNSNRSVSRKPGQPITDLRIKMTPAAVISGKLVDDEGSPVEGGQVMALRYEMIEGQRKLEPVNSPVQSDDLGEYRISGLRAGSYFVRASAGDLGNWDRSYVPEYYRGGLQPVAEGLVEVKSGEERGGIDVRFTKHEGVTVEGHVVFADGASAPRTMVSVYLQPDDFGAQPFFAVRNATDGTFRMTHVPAGSYTLELASGGSMKAGDLFGRQRLEVGTAAVRDAVLTVREMKPVDISGSIAGAEGRPVSPMAIGLRGQTGSGVSTYSNDDGTFTLKGVLPGHYDLQVMPEHMPADPGDGNFGHAVSATLGDKDVLQGGIDVDAATAAPTEPLEIRISDRMCKLRGKLFDVAGKPLADAMVTVVGGQSRLQGAAITDSDGTFSLMARAAGRYRIYAIADQGSADSLDDPAYLQAHENDFPAVTLAEGENAPLTLRLPRN